MSGGTHNIVRVRQTLAGAFDVLSATLLQRSSHFAALLNSAVIPLTGAALPNADSRSHKPLTQSVLGAVIGMSRASIAGREDNVSLYESETLQGLLDKSVVNVETMGKKQMKKLMRAEKDAAKRKKTIARLEMRLEEVEEKQERKRRKSKKVKEATSRAVESVSTKKVVEEIVLDDSDDEAEPFERRDLPRTLFEDSKKTELMDEDEDSRYSIGSPAQLNGKSEKSNNDRGKGKGKLKEVIYVHGSSSEGESSEGDDGESEQDEDVVIGGGIGGDRLVGSGKVTQQSGGSAEDADSSTGSSEEEVFRHLVVVPSREDKQKKKDEKTTFWNSKGVKEPDLEGFQWDD